MSERNDDHQALQRRLERLSTALSAAPDQRVAPASSPTRPPSKAPGRVLFSIAVAVVAVGIATGDHDLFTVAAVMFVLSMVVGLRNAGVQAMGALPLPLGNAHRDSSRAHIGMGATVAEDAVVEPGATVEMGATVKTGAVIKRGAVVRMGATVGPGAVLEEGASVGWGADIRSDAVVGRDAVVGAGATVGRGARVPDGMRLFPGTDWKGGSSRASDAVPGLPDFDSQSSGTRAAAQPQPVRDAANARTSAGASTGTPAVGAGPGRTSTAPAAPKIDPREARIHSACERIASELQSSPESVRSLLGATAQTASALRSTCMGLLERERVLRAESSPEQLDFLQREKAELDGRIASASDASVRRSLQSAVAAIEEQLRQRALLRTQADRLDAELTRLQWTLDGMATQLVRLRTAGAEASALPPTEVLQTMQQLHGEIDAIAEALEHVARGEPESPLPEPDARAHPNAPAWSAVAPISSEPGSQTGSEVGAGELSPRAPSGRRVR